MPSKLTKVAPSLISQIVGSRPSLMPGESADQYQKALRSLIEEMGASTHMQAYLVQQMLDCTRDLHSYSVASRGIIFNEMLCIIAGSRYNADDLQLPLVQAVHAGDWDNELLIREMTGKGHTHGSLYALAVDRAREKLHDLHQLSAARTKLLMQLQGSYEALVNRPILQERLRMQNEQMRRDLGAIDVGGSHVSIDAAASA